MQRSTVKWFDAKKGYGFIDHPDGGNDVFVHYSQIVSEKDFKTLRTGQEVKFELSDGPKGLHALEVEPLGEPNEDENAETAAEPSNGAQAAEAHSTSAPESHDAEADDDDEWEWDEDWTDEHGNPPDPMAGPTF